MHEIEDFKKIEKIIELNARFLPHTLEPPVGYPTVVEKIPEEPQVVEEPQIIINYDNNDAPGGVSPLVIK